MNVVAIEEDATLQLEGDQYKAYTLITSSITSLLYTSVHFFVTSPSGIGKSFLLKSLESWCQQSRYKPLLLASTRIATNNISSKTIHLALLVFSNSSTYRSLIFLGDPSQANELQSIKVLIIDKVSIVDTQLFCFISTIFSQLH